ncbi:hypothetical protein GCM10025866_03020 [Naasia aerilata]|uniref:Uncharacterized protein n=1 Tax=Naasia aerilata TaxID=1162966 RepID=A0ABN6XLZ5_9MICO|nr:hypothetical protein GCM10025866_03020 [Naasia aerilata]
MTAANAPDVREHERPLHIEEAIEILHNDLGHFVLLRHGGSLRGRSRAKLGVDSASGAGAVAPKQSGRGGQAPVSAA